ncbi:MAG: glycosyltransferase family 2 protein [Rhabdochlamydiaceae bacterium]
MVDVSVITVTHQSKEFIADQILSVVLGAFRVNYEQIVVDNGSTDGTVGLIEGGYANYVKLIKNVKNLGFAAANNQALIHAKGRYILFLNPDMQLEFGALDKLIPWMDESPRIGIAGCKLVDREGFSHEALQPRRFLPCVVNLTFSLNVLSFFPSLKPLFQYVPFDPEKEQEVDSVRGAMMLVRKEVVEKLGRSFDPRYFLLFEDFDLCREVHHLGYRVVYTPKTFCIDLFHRSFLHHCRLWKHLQMSKGLWVYASKWYGPIEKILIFVAIPMGFFLRFPCWVLRWKNSFHKRG